MQVQLSADAQELLQQQLVREGFASADEAIENAIRFYEAHRPTADSLNVKLRAGHRSALAGEVGPLDTEDIQRRGRERLAASKGTA